MVEIDTDGGAAICAISGLPGKGVKGLMKYGKSGGV
jgi:hypothetical protein